MVGQRLERRAVEAQLVVDVEQPGRGRDQVCLDAEDTGPLQQARAVDRAAGAGESDDEAVRLQLRRSVWSSPAWCISIMMSEPPMNSPLTYSWGMVGQLA